MQLTRYTDYGLRVLIYIALLPEGRRASIDEISEVYDVSRNIINKIVHQLGKEKVIQTIRGKGGGFHLLMQPKDINIGEMVATLENSLEVIDCDHPGNTCKILGSCKLKSVLNLATAEFMKTLSKYTLADLIDSRQENLIQMLEIEIE